MTGHVMPKKRIFGVHGIMQITVIGRQIDLRISDFVLQKNSTIIHSSYIYGSLGVNSFYWFHPFPTLSCFEVWTWSCFKAISVCGRPRTALAKLIAGCCHPDLSSGIAYYSRNTLIFTMWYLRQRWVMRSRKQLSCKFRFELQQSRKWVKSINRIGAQLNQKRVDGWTLLKYKVGNT